MSAFLGPIHTWLYEKIKLQDEMTTYFLNHIDLKEINSVKELNSIKESMNRRYGVLEEGELADIIDGMNIHGWLQERVSMVENRLAYVVTMLQKEEIATLDTICQLAYEYGKTKKQVSSCETVEQAYKMLEDVLLNGMPCDRVNQVVEVEETRLVWKQNIEIHGSYWNMVDGNIEDYYKIREQFICGMLESTMISFEPLDYHTFSLIKKE